MSAATGIDGAAGFADVMAELAAGVSLVTTRDGDRPVGLLVTSMVAYTADPPSVLLSVAHSSRTHPPLCAGGRFGIHLLGAGQEALARVFASKSTDKFGAVAWSWDGEVPRVEGALAYLRCETDAAFDHRDHTILVGRVEAVERALGVEPLLYWRREMTWRIGPR